MSEDLQAFLGLPSFSSEIEVRHRWWAHSAYNAIQQLYVSKGFNLKTPNLTWSLNYSILEVVGNEGRFEELQESLQTRASKQWSIKKRVKNALTKVFERPENSKGKKQA
ncbi:hypothetical protein MPER_08827 [Moniliophthora perniciosa FA553]|nr:hypothetical protein MPER_08827 [Moniliophthora perniciosa FA553]